MRTCRFLPLLLVTLTIAGAMLPARPRAQPTPTPTLAIPGRTNTAPWVASAGRFVAVTWGAQADKASDVYVAVSDDEGATFGAPVKVNAVAGDGRISGEIPPRVALYLPPGARTPEVVVAWNAKDRGTEIKLARSRDGGHTFAAPSSLQASGAAGDRGWHALTLDAQGVAHVVWLDHRGLAEGSAHGGGMAHGAAKAEEVPDGVAMAQKSRLHYARIGATAQPEQILAPGVCYCCKTALAPTRRGVLAAWRHVFAGNMRDVAFTWLGTPAAAAAPARVSEDGWSINGCPDDGPALAVGADDRIHAVWPTVVPGEPPTGGIFYAVLAANGERFSPRQRVPTLGTPKPSHPQVVVDGTGRLFFAWDEVVGGVRTAATSDAEASPAPLQFSAATRLSPAGPTSYPVMAPLDRGAIVAWVSGPPDAAVIAVRRLSATTASTAR